MRRIRLTVAYDGTDYCGWQVQNNGATIEGELNTAADRTDSEGDRGEPDGCRSSRERKCGCI